MKKLRLYFISDPAVTDDPGGALATEAKIIKDHILIKDLNDLIRRTIQHCVKHKAQVGVMVIASHGNTGTFVLGPTLHHATDNRLWALAVLQPFFAKDGVLIINACECGNSQDLMMKLAKILGVTVVGYTGMIDVYKWLVWEGIKPSGNTVICTATGCRESNSWDEGWKKIDAGGGLVAEKPGYARDF